MGMCKEAVNWKYLEIYQEFKHILKGHLCTRSNQNQQYHHTGTLDNAPRDAVDEHYVALTIYSSAVQIHRQS